MSGQSDELAALASAARDALALWAAPKLPARDYTIEPPKSSTRCGLDSLIGEGQLGVPIAFHALRCGSWAHARDATWKAARWAPLVVGWSADACLEAAKGKKLAIIEALRDYRAVSPNRGIPITDDSPKIAVVRVPTAQADASVVRDVLSRRADTIRKQGLNASRVVVATKAATYVVAAASLASSAGKGGRGRPPRVTFDWVFLPPPLAAWYLYLVLSSGAVWCHRGIPGARGEDGWSEPKRNSSRVMEKVFDRRATGLTRQAECCAHSRYAADLENSLSSSAAELLWDEAFAEVEAELKQEIGCVVDEMLLDRPTSNELLDELSDRVLRSWLWDHMASPEAARALSDRRFSITDVINEALHNLGAVEVEDGAQRRWCSPKKEARFTAAARAAAVIVRDAINAGVGDYQLWGQLEEAGGVLAGFCPADYRRLLIEARRLIEDRRCSRCGANEAVCLCTVD